MNIKTMLLRLQNALGQDNLSEQMLLYSGPSTALDSGIESKDSVNFVVGYNGSPNSQTALDFVFWMAHQTRLTTCRQVTVHVTYVLDSCNSLDSSCSAASSLNELRKQITASPPSDSVHESQSTRSVLTLPKPAASTPNSLVNNSLTEPYLLTSLEHADRILWQARCLADEWRGSLEAHLRFGSAASELRQVVEAEHADLLFVGCSSVEHSLVQRLISDFPCPVLGIPPVLEAN